MREMGSLKYWLPYEKYHKFVAVKHFKASIVTALTQWKTDRESEEGEWEIPAELLNEIYIYFHIIWYYLKKKKN